MVAAQVVTEQALATEQFGGVCAPCASLGLELLAYWVVDLKRLATVVDAVEVTETSGRDETEAAERARRPNMLGNRWHDELCGIFPEELGQMQGV